MIVELLVSAFMAVVGALVDLIPTSGAPAWVSSGSGYLAQTLNLGAGLSAWIPFGLAGTVITAVLSSVAIGFAIKVVRIVASFLTAGGGSAA